MAWAFDEFELDTEACQLRRRGRAVVLQPRVFDTLRYLIENSSRVVSRKELLDALWKGQTVNPGAVPWSVNHVRRALGQRALDRYPIETIRGRGYRFVAGVRRAGVRSEPPPEAAPANWAISDTSEGPLVGRADVMARLSDALRVARAGEGAVVLLTGSQGIGKTRCMTELAALAQTWGIAVWSGRCISDGGAPGLFPFIRILRDACADRSLSPADRADAEELLSRMTPSPNAVGVKLVGEGAVPDPGRFWLLDRLVHFLWRSAEQRARLVLLDDLQDADAGSIDVLTWLAPELARTKLLVVASARASVNGAGTDAFERIRPARVQALAPWRVHDVERYLEDRIGKAVSPSWGPAIFALSAGNPLFVREAVSLLADRRTLGPSEDLSPDALPLLTQEILGRRVATLPPDVRSTLEIACVIGEQFDLPLLQRVTDLRAPDLLSRLEAAISARFIRSEPTLERYEFSHGLIHAALYDALPASRRAPLHAEVARALESMSAFEPRLYELAHHLHKGLPESGYARAITAACHAGDAAMHAYAYEDAAKFYAWALSAQRYAEVPDPRKSSELLLSSAFALRRAGRIDESLLQCARAIDLATREGFADLLLEAASHLRPTVWLAPVPDELSLCALTHAIELFPEEARAERARVSARLACTQPHAAVVEESQARAKQAVALARSVGDPALVVETLGSQLYGFSGPDTLDELLAVSEEMIRLATPATRWWTAEAYYGRYIAFLQRADLAGADRALAAFGEVANALRMPEAIWQYESFAALRRLHAGELEYAEKRFAELDEQATRQHLSYSRFTYAYQKNVLRMERRGHPWFAGHPEPLNDADWTWARSIACHRATRIVLQLDLGADAEARVEFAALASDGFSSVTRDHSYLFTLCKLSLAAVELRDAEQAGVLYEKLLPYSRYNPVHGWGFWLGSVAYFLGVLARFLGDTTTAVSHYEVALGIHRSLGYKSQILRTELALAELSHASPPLGEGQRTRTSAEQVRVAARKLGMVGLAERATLIAAAAR